MTVAPSGKRQRFRIIRYDAERELAFVLHCHHQDHQDEGFMGLVTYL
jgi:FtsP/CotA-like multicopper oxidase with cupredoxin domain